MFRFNRKTGKTSRTGNYSNVAKLSAGIPVEDFVDAAFDQPTETETTRLLVILSTPRSGSTLLCEMLSKNGVCLAHEYFQRFQYLPILADRWGCLVDRRVDERSFVAALKRYRTFENGVLGINLHGEHLYDFVPFEGHFGDIPTDYLVLIRRDHIAQAVSFEIALQTQRWSSKFKRQHTPDYHFAGIEKRLRSIQDQNTLIRAFVDVRSSSPDVVCYEDLVDDAGHELGKLACLRGYDIGHARPSVLQRQSNSLNQEWIARFSEQYFEKRARI